MMMADAFSQSLAGTSFGGGMKRSAAEFSDGPGKAARVDEEWTCPACGNENRAGRMSCNMRKCQMLKPGLTLKDLQRAPAGGGKPGGGVSPAGVPREFQPGAWVCRGCGNQNYPGRLTCNKRGCGLPAEQGQAVGGMDPMLAQIAMMAQGMVGGPGMGMMGGLAQTRAMPKPAVPAPDNSWICIECNNINFPTRMECNGKNCRKPRAEVDGGPAPSGANSNRPPSARQSTAMTGTPEQLNGAWTCPSCGNLNYGTRMSCNKRTCGKPRPAGM